MSIMNKLTKKVFSCPSCQKKLRVPIRPGKTLMVSCPGCSTQFNLQFKNPLTDFFTWYRGKGLLFNFKSMFYRFKLLPLMSRISIIFILGLLVQAVFSLSTSTFEKTKTPALKDPEWKESIIEEI